MHPGIILNDGFNNKKMGPLNPGYCSRGYNIEYNPFPFEHSFFRILS